MFKSIYQVISFIHDSRHGFLTGRSFTTQLLLLHHDWFKVLDKSGQVHVVFTDFFTSFVMILSLPNFTNMMSMETCSTHDLCRDSLRSCPLPMIPLCLSREEGMIHFFVGSHVKMPDSGLFSDWLRNNTSEKLHSDWLEVRRPFFRSGLSLAH